MDNVCILVLNQNIKHLNSRGCCTHIPQDCRRTMWLWEHRGVRPSQESHCGERFQYSWSHSRPPDESPVITTAAASSYTTQLRLCSLLQILFQDLQLRSGLSGGSVFKVWVQTDGWMRRRLDQQLSSDKWRLGWASRRSIDTVAHPLESKFLICSR